MNVKKSKNADLESKRKGFRALGFIIAGSIVLLAFSFRTVKLSTISAYLEDDASSMKEEIIEEFELPDLEPPPEAPPQAPPPVIEEVKEVENNEDIPDIPPPPPTDPNDIPDDDPPPIKKTVIHDVVGKSPEYPGGPAEMAAFIQETFEYPEMAREMGEQGTIWVEFVVYSDGKIKDVKVVKGVSASLDKEAMRVVKRMPHWQPGEQAGKAVNVRYTIPIKARLG